MFSISAAHRRSTDSISNFMTIYKEAGAAAAHIFYRGLQNLLIVLGIVARLTTTGLKSNFESILGMTQLHTKP